MKILALILIAFHPTEGAQLEIIPVERCPITLDTGPDIGWICVEITIPPLGEPA